MKTFILKILTASCVLALWLTASAQTENDTTLEQKPPATADNNNATEAQPAEEAAPPAVAPRLTLATNEEANTEETLSADQLMQMAAEAQNAADQQDQTMESQPANGNTTVTPSGRRPLRVFIPRGNQPNVADAQSLASFATNAAARDANAGAKTIRLNFREARLSQVLDYLSSAAGFTVSAPGVNLNGNITAWSNHPVDKTEAVSILNDALIANGYAATLEGNVLTVYEPSPSTSKIENPISANSYTNIPPVKDVVTQTVYVHNVEASQLIQTLQGLMPPGTSMTANQGANAILITDTKANIRRMAKIVSILDTSSVSASTVRVFPLQYADATQLAQVIQQLFQNNSSSSNNRQFGRGGRGGRFGGFNPFAQQAQQNTTATTGRMEAPQVVAVADDRSNSLVVSASAEQMALIEQLVQSMDVNVDDVTELRVFPLRYADPQETADELADLFPDSSNSQNGRNQQIRFGRRGFPFNFGNNTSNDQNSRASKQSRVVAVADPRTRSVIVSAAHELMDQIAGVIGSLDSDPAQHKKVFIMQAPNVDPQILQDTMQSLFADPNNRNSMLNQRNNNQIGNQFNSRATQQNSQGYGNNRTGVGTTGNRSTLGN